MSVCILNSARAEILIDSKDYDRVSQFTWTVRNERGRRYVVRTTRENRTIRLHRFINETPDGLDEVWAEIYKRYGGSVLHRD